MTDIQTHLSKIRSDAAECILLSGLATDDARREMFVKTAQHLNLLAFEIEKTIAANSAKSPHGESVTLVPLAQEELVTTDIAAVNKHAAGSGDPEKAVDADIAVAHHQPAARPRRMLPWLLVIVLGGIVWAFLWANKPVKDYWTLLSTLPSKLSALQSTHEASSSPQDDTKQALATLLSEEQADRKRLSDQIGALSARLDNLVTALGNLKISRGEVAGPPNKIGVEDQAPIAEPKSVAPETKPVYREQNNIPAPEAPAAAKQSGGVPPRSEVLNQLIELERLRLLQGEPNSNRENPPARSAVCSFALSIRYPGHTRRWMGGGGSAIVESGRAPRFQYHMTGSGAAWQGRMVSGPVKRALDRL